ncbi:MAG: hypothetical protein V4465_03320 [Patescibacteria group bacterium]
MSDHAIRTAIFISSHLIAGAGTKGPIHDARVLEPHGHRAYVSADSIKAHYSLHAMEDIVGAHFDDVDLIVVFMQPFETIVSSFTRAGIPGEKMMYAICCEDVTEAEEAAEELHPGSHVVQVKCGADPAFGHLLRRFLASGTVHKHAGSRHHALT